MNPGANADLGAQDVPSRLVRSKGEVVVIQHEIAPDVVDLTVLRAREQGGVVVLNPAPARPIDTRVLAAVDVLVPNLGELASLLGADLPATLDEARGLLERAELPCRAVVVTLGADGALLKEAHSTDITHIPTPFVDVVDTVGRRRHLLRRPRGRPRTWHRPGRGGTRRARGVVRGHRPRRTGVHALRVPARRTRGHLCFLTRGSPNSTTENHP